MPYTIPNVADAGFSDQAEPDSRDFEILTAGVSHGATTSTSGLGQTGVQSGCAVTAQGSPDMTVAVASGTVRIGGRKVAVSSGNVTITAADGSNPRFDLIVVDTAGAKTAIAGTAASNAVFPTISSGKVVLAAVYVPASDTAINTNQITDKRVMVPVPPHEDVTWYGAIGDDSTTNTTAIQAALDAANAAGGGVVFFPVGTFRSGTLTTYPKVTMRGAGVRATILKTANTTNGDLVRGLNFATLTGKAYAVGDMTLGAYLAQLEDMTIDGNKANNSSGYGVRIWGSKLRFKNLEVQNCKSGGIWTEFTTHDGITSPDDLIEGQFVNIKTMLNDGHGWTFRGPHDSSIVNYVTEGNTGWGFRSEDSASSYNGSIAGGSSGWNSWANTLGGFFINTTAIVNGLEVGGVTTGDIGLELGSASGSAKFTGVLVNGCDVGIRARGDQHHFVAQVSNCTTDGFKIDGLGTSVAFLTGTGNQNGINTVSEPTPNMIFATMNVGTGDTLYSGGAGSAFSTRFWIGIDGGGGNSQLIRLPTRAINWQAGWTPQLPDSNQILPAIDVDNDWIQIQSVRYQPSTTFTVPDGFFAVHKSELRLTSTTRATLEGDACLYVED